MTVTAASLKARYEEFAPVGDPAVTLAIGEATRRTDARVFGDRFDDAVMLRACDLMSTGAFGQQARVDPKAATGPTTYAIQLATLVGERAGGGWAAGQLPTGDFL